MIIKKYQAETEAAAMEQAKAELGKDAIVMNIKTITPRGIYKFFRKPCVEVTAAVDDNNSYQGENHSAFTSIQQKGQSAKTEAVAQPVVTDASAIEKKLNDLQTLLEKQMIVSTAAVATAEKAMVQNMELQEEQEQQTVMIQPEKDVEASKNSTPNKKDACIQLIRSQLVQNEVDEKYANQIIAEIEGSLKKDASVDNILGAVYQKIILKMGHPSPLELEEGKTKYVFFIGPTGVGKTTTIAKIASSFKLGKKANVAMLTADTYRIAAVEQLRTYANILSIPLKVVYSAEEVAETRTDLEGFDLVLVDTAGRSHRSQEQCEDIKRLIDAVPAEQREIYLVLSATTKYRDLMRITETYQEISDFKLIFTKLDETGSYGNLLNIRMMTGAPLSYNTWGQNVPDDIGPVNAQQIAKHLLGGGE